MDLSEVVARFQFAFQKSLGLWLTSWVLRHSAGWDYKLGGTATLFRWGTVLVAYLLAAALPGPPSGWCPAPRGRPREAGGKRRRADSTYQSGYRRGWPPPRVMKRGTGSFGECPCADRSLTYFRWRHCPNAGTVRHCARTAIATPSGLAAFHTENLPAIAGHRWIRQFNQRDKALAVLFIACASSTTTVGLQSPASPFMIRLGTPVFRPRQNSSALVPNTCNRGVHGPRQRLSSTSTNTTRDSVELMTLCAVPATPRYGDTGS